MCPEPTSSDSPTSLSVSKWTMDIIYPPPKKKHQFQYIPRSVAKKGEDWVMSAPRPGTEVPGGKGFPLMLHSFGHCLLRGSEESAGPQPLLCTR